MFYESISKYIEGVEKFRGTPSVYELREFPRTTVNEKVELVIKLMRIIKGIGYEGMMLGLDKSIRINEQELKQEFSNAISFSNKPKVAIGALYKIMSMLIKDLNCELPARHKNKLLEKCLDSKPDEYGIRDFKEFFSLALSEYEQDEVKRMQSAGGLTGQKDVDWKAMSFSVKIKDGTMYPLIDRVSLLKMKGDDIDFIIDEYRRDGLMSEQLMNLLDNLDKCVPQARKGLKQSIMTSILFKQPFSKYQGLVKNVNRLREIAKKN